MLDIQKEHKEWVDREYPKQPPYIPLTGMVEEAGELLHAVLKMEQQRIWGDEPRYKRLHDDLVDAIGDCAIYCCSLCNTVGQQFTCERERDYKLIGGFNTFFAVEFVKYAAEGVQRTDYRAYIDGYLGRLKEIAWRLNIDFEAAVRSTWARVKLRSRSVEQPRIVCLCGSTRFKSAWYDETKRLTHLGYIVLGVGDLDPNHPNTNVPIDPELKARLDVLHLRKIDKADEVRVLNCKREYCDCCDKWVDELNDCGYSMCCESLTTSRPYIGESTAREIAYAKLHNKPITYLEPQS